nr:M23 family peptidase [Desulfobacteraceae bacterium]
MKKTLASVLILITASVIVYALFYLFEGKAPIIETALPSGFLKKEQEFSFTLHDPKTGLQQVMVTLSQQGKQTILIDKQYESSGLLNLFSGSKILTDSFRVPIDALKYGITDGELTLSITASDNSLWGWGKGNISHIEKQLVYDSKPPEIHVLSEQHNIERGGSGLILYKIFEENIKTGVQVGDDFFPGHPDLVENKSIYACFFALSYLQGPGTKISLVAEDMAGNITRKSFYH